MGGAAWPGGLGITVAQKKAGMEEKEDLVPGSRGRREGWWWQKGAQSGRGDAVRRTGGRHRTEPQMERTGRGGQRVGGGPGAHPSPEPACPGPAHLSCDALTSLWGCQQLGPATTRSRTALGGRAGPWRTARSQKPSISGAFVGRPAGKWVSVTVTVSRQRWRGATQRWERGLESGGQGESPFCQLKAGTLLDGDDGDLMVQTVNSENNSPSPVKEGVLPRQDYVGN